MKKVSRWGRCQMECPEGKGDGYLFVHWEIEGDEESIQGVRCDNMYLKDLSGGDCQWSCWEKISDKE